LKTFHVSFARLFEVEIKAEDGKAAKVLADQVAAQFPENTCTLLSIVEDGYVEKPCAACEAGDLEKPEKPPGGRPNGGGAPGTPVVKQEVLVDQIAQVA